jgi:Transcriptional antiterminator
MFEISAKIIDYAENKIENEFDPNLIFTLADHVNFVIDRYHKNINMKYPLQYDIEGLYPSEMAVGRASVKFINKVMKIQLPSSEAAGIALHFINAEQKTSLKDGVADSDRIINEITHIIEKDLGITIDRNTLNYSRYATHIQYLLKRRDTQTVISTENHKIYDSVKKDFPQIYECVLQILDYFETDLHWKMNDEELLYLMLHINRLCSREDCYH